MSTSGIDWRQNPNLVECFENWRMTVRGMSLKPRPPSRAEIIRRRRLSLGLSKTELDRAAGYSFDATGRTESGSSWYQRIADTLDRLEAERKAQAPR